MSSVADATAGGSRVGRSLGVWCAVLVGGAIGTGVRATVDLATASAHPWPTLIVNVLGTFVLGLLVSRVWSVAPEWLRAGLGTGLLGGFTTFSALALAVVEQPGAERIGFLVASVALGVVAAVAGLRLGAHGRRAAATASMDDE